MKISVTSIKIQEQLNQTSSIRRQTGNPFQVTFLGTTPSLDSDSNQKFPHDFMVVFVNPLEPISFPNLI